MLKRTFLGASGAVVLHHFVLPQCIVRCVHILSLRCGVFCRSIPSSFPPSDCHKQQSIHPGLPPTAIKTQARTGERSMIGPSRLKLSLPFLLMVVLGAFLLLSPIPHSLAQQDTPMSINTRNGMTVVRPPFT